MIWFVSPLPSLAFSVYLAAAVAPKRDIPHAQIPSLRVLGQTASFMLAFDHCPCLPCYITELTTSCPCEIGQQVKEGLEQQCLC